MFRPWERETTLSEMRINLENTSNTSELFKLIKKKDWDSAAQCCESSQGEASMWNIEYNNDGSERWKLLPIHQACEMRSPDWFIQTLLGAYPEGAHMRDSSGGLPIHLACRGRASEAVVNILLTSYPKSVEVKDDDGRLPLHFACREGVDLKVVTKLLMKNYVGAQVADMHGLLPIHWACSQNADEVVVKALLRAFPASTKVKDKWGRTPLTLAQATNKTNQDAVVQVLSRDESFWSLSLINEISVLNSEIKKHVSSEAALTQRIVDLESELDHITNKSKEALEASSKENKCLKEVVMSLEESLDTSMKSSTTTENQNSSLSEKTNELIKTNQHQEKQVNVLKVHAYSLEDKNKELAEKLNRANNRNKSLLAMQEEYEARLQKISTLLQFMKEDQNIISSSMGRLGHFTVEHKDEELGHMLDLNETFMGRTGHVIAEDKIYGLGGNFDHAEIELEYHRRRV